MAQEKAPHSGHRERMRKRFLEQGIESFEPHEMLEILLYYSVPRRDTNELGHLLLQHFGSISAVFEADIDELMQVKGITENTAALIKMIPAMARVYLSDRREQHILLDDSRKIGEYLVQCYVGYTNEVVMLLSLDSSLHLLGCDIVSEGNVTSSYIDTKKIAERLIRRNAACAVLAHNHPRGLAIPSNDDVLLTRDLKRTLAALEINLVDHIVVADGLWCSIMERYSLT